MSYGSGLEEKFSQEELTKLKNISDDPAFPNAVDFYLYILIEIVMEMEQKKIEPDVIKDELQ